MEVYDRHIRSLPDVIRALEECDGGGDKCAACAYNDVGDGCGNVVEMDALFWLKELRRDNERLRSHLKTARAERDIARKHSEDIMEKLCRSCGNGDYVHEYEMYVCRCGDDCNWVPKEEAV